MNQLSIDIGGTKIRVVVYSVNFKILKQKLYKTEDLFKQYKPRELDILLKGIREAFGSNFDKVGISINCLLHKNHVIYSSLLGGKVNINLKKLTEKYFIFKKFNSDNDVVTMAKAELLLGYGKKCKNFLYINLGTGIRLVAVENGVIVRGKNNTAGEISQDEIWVEELNKYIKIDDLISGKGFFLLGLFLQKKKTNAKEALAENNQELIFLFVKYLSKLLTSATYFYNPKIIIIGGSITLSSSKWLKKLKIRYYQDCHPLLAAEKIYLSGIKYPASRGSLIL